MKRILITICLIAIAVAAKSQDKIYTLDNFTIYCKIKGGDWKSYFIRKHGDTSDIEILKTSVNSVCYNCDVFFPDTTKRQGYYLQKAGNEFQKYIKFNTTAQVLMLGAAASTFIAIKQESDYQAALSNPKADQSQTNSNIAWGVMGAFYISAITTYYIGRWHFVQGVKYIGMEGAMLQLKFPIK